MSTNIMTQISVKFLTRDTKAETLPPMAMDTNNAPIVIPLTKSSLLCVFEMSETVFSLWKNAIILDEIFVYVATLSDFSLRKYAGY